MRYRPELDGIRAFAVLAVVFYHAGHPLLRAGFIGVDVFFVLSGYLITTILVAERRVDLFHFYARRARRILPLMVLVCLATLPLGWFLMLPHQFKDHGQALVAAPLFLSNMLYWWESGYFTVASAEKPLLHLWSLGVEGQFYIAFPLILIAARRIGLLVPALIALSVASFGLSVWGSYRAPDAAYYLIPFRFWEFLAGSLTAVVQPRRRWWGGPTGIGMIAVSMGLITDVSPFPGAAAVPVVLGTVLVMCGGGAVQRALSLPALTLMGRLSYGLYLWHFPVFVFWRMAFPDHSLNGDLWLLLPALVMLAWISHHLVERRWIARPERGWRQAAGLATLSMCVLAGGALSVARGVPDRLPVTALILPGTYSSPCHDHLDSAAILKGEDCRIGTATDPTIALIGDSHAGHLAAALDARLRARGQAGLSFTASWCAPVPGFGTHAPTRGPGCAGYMSAAWDRVLSEPGVTTVVVAAQWGNYSQGYRSGLSPVPYAFDGAPAADDRPLEHALAALSERLKRSGKQIVVVGPLPEFHAPVPDTLARRSWAGLQPTEHLAPIDPVVRNAEAMRALAWLVPVARMILPDKVFCTAADRCRVMAPNGTLYYRDGNHLTQAGAEVVVAQVMRLVDDPPQQIGGTPWTSTPAAAGPPGSGRTAPLPDRS